MPMLMGPPNRACYKHTCRIQQCLSENNYDSRSCAWAIEALKRCCEMPFAAHSIHCAFPDLNRQQPGEGNTPQKKEESAAEEKNVTQPSSKGKETEERIGGSKADAPG